MRHSGAAFLLGLALAATGCGGKKVEINPETEPVATHWNATLATPKPAGRRGAGEGHRVDGGREGEARPRRGRSCRSRTRCRAASIPGTCTSVSAAATAASSVPPTRTSPSASARTGRLRRRRCCRCPFRHRDSTSSTSTRPATTWGPSSPAGTSHRRVSSAPLSSRAQRGILPVRARSLAALGMTVCGRPPLNRRRAPPECRHGHPTRPRHRRTGKPAGGRAGAARG